MKGENSCHGKRLVSSCVYAICRGNSFIYFHHFITFIIDLHEGMQKPDKGCMQDLYNKNAVLPLTSVAAQVMLSLWQKNGSVFRHFPVKH